MKFLHYALLIAGTSAMKLKQMNTISLDKKVDEVTQAEWEELGKALYSYTDDGESLSFPEMKGEVVDWAKKNDVEPFKGWEKALKHLFKMIDTNGDKEISRKEADAVIKEHEDVQLGSMATLLTKDPMADLEAGVKAELEKDGGLSLDELYALIEKIAAKYDFDLPQGWKGHVKKMFDWVDSNNDGTVTGPEIESAMKKAGKGKDDDLVQLSAHIKSAIGAKNMAQDPMDDLEDGVKAELEKDGGLSLGELYALIKEVAAKYDYDLPKGWKVEVKKMFDWVDANHDGTVTGPEIEKAMAKAGKGKDDDLVQLSAHIKSAVGAKVLTKDPMDDIEAGVKDELEKDGGLTLKELNKIIEDVADKYDFDLPEGWKQHVKKLFDWVDSNNDGVVTGPEIEDAMAQAGKGKDDDLVQLKITSKIQSSLQLEDPTKEQWQELGKAIWDSTGGDETLESDELVNMIEAWATKHGFADKLPKGWKEYVGKIFKYVDANDDGHVTRDELEAAMKKGGK